MSAQGLRVLHAMERHRLCRYLPLSLNRRFKWDQKRRSGFRYRRTCTLATVTRSRGA